LPGVEREGGRRDGGATGTRALSLHAEDDTGQARARRANPGERAR
jgi:hypothetical protein